MELFTTPALACPSCPDRPLLGATSTPLQAHQCPGCNGAFLAVGQVPSLLYKILGATPQEAQEASQASAPGQRACPSCHAQLRDVFIKGTQVEVCPQCRGAWVPSGLSPVSQAYDAAGGTLPAWDAAPQARATSGGFPSPSAPAAPSYASAPQTYAAPAAAPSWASPAPAAAPSWASPAPASAPSWASPSPAAAPEPSWNTPAAAPAPAPTWQDAPARSTTNAPPTAAPARFPGAPPARQPTSTNRPARAGTGVPPVVTRPAPDTPWVKIAVGAVLVAAAGLGIMAFQRPAKQVVEVQVDPDAFLNIASNTYDSHEFGGRTLPWWRKRLTAMRAATSPEEKAQYALALRKAKGLQLDPVEEPDGTVSVRVSKQLARTIFNRLRSL